MNINIKLYWIFFIYLFSHLTFETFISIKYIDISFCNGQKSK